MKNTVTLGRTNITVNRNGFGALPIQRINQAQATLLLSKALNSGINFIDTARMYTDSEQKIGIAISHRRNEFVLATKTAAKTVEEFWLELETSLKLLKTDHIDIYQLHNPAFCPKPGDSSGLYDAMIQAKAQGKILHIGITNHRQPVAIEAIESGLYDTVQFPFCYLASDKDAEIVRLCKQNNVGFIAMKGMSGGLITRSDAAYAFIAQFDNVLPIWGVQKESELDDFIGYIINSPKMNSDILAHIERDKSELSGAFCRGCGYCMPCPKNIEINNCNRMILLLGRSETKSLVSEAWQAKMNLVDACTSCGQCMTHCPYALDIPSQLKRNLAFYREFIKK